GYEEEEVQGRCAAVLSNGRRCPNASLPGSRYCGLETHQALADIATDNVADLSADGGEQADERPSGEQDVAALAHDGETDAAPEADAAPATDAAPETEIAAETEVAPEADAAPETEVAAETDIVPKTEVALNIEAVPEAVEAATEAPAEEPAS
ncbi:MAG TPA: hypothetical protein VJ996_02625, partial [Solirubrobacteraceae bacterium]|nr:hypothetical protein [Solirubrobacteraceae bacterium]